MTVHCWSYLYYQESITRVRYYVPDILEFAQYQIASRFLKLTNCTTSGYHTVHCWSIECHLFGLPSSQNLEALMVNQSVRPEDCLRLGLLFTLRYEAQSRDIERIDRWLKSRGLSETDMRVSVCLSVCLSVQLHSRYSDLL